MMIWEIVDSIVVSILIQINVMLLKMAIKFKMRYFLWKCSFRSGMRWFKSNQWLQRVRWQLPEQLQDWDHVQVAGDAADQHQVSAPGGRHACVHDGDRHIPPGWPLHRPHPRLPVPRLYGSRSSLQNTSSSHHYWQISKVTLGLQSYKFYKFKFCDFLTDICMIAVSEECNLDGVIVNHVGMSDTNDIWSSKTEHQMFWMIGCDYCFWTIHLRNRQ